MAGPRATTTSTTRCSSGSRPVAGGWAERRVAGWKTAAAAATLGAAAVVGARVGGRAMVARTERRLCRTAFVPPYYASERAKALHERLLVADLHADSLLWGRDLLARADRGHVDVP